MRDKNWTYNFQKETICEFLIMSHLRQPRVTICVPLLFTRGSISCNFVIPVNAVICHLLDFVYFIPYNDVIFSQSTQGIHFTSCQNMFTVDWKHEIHSSCQYLDMSILCLYFSFKTCVFVTHILIGSSYHWLCPFKSVAMWPWKFG